MQKLTNIAFSASNIANYGSADHEHAKELKANAETEFEDAGKKEGVIMYHVENFGVKKINFTNKLYGGDCYIVLNSFKATNSDKLSHNVHFWLGSESTLDEIGTAAYKTVELDDHLSDLPVQYRETQGNESNLFLDLFKNGLYILNGGSDSAFNHITAKEYKPRLLHIKGKKRTTLTQVPLKISSLNHGDVFVLDLGLTIIQWNGIDSNIFEKRKAANLIDSLKNDRLGKAKSHILDGLEDDDNFWSILDGNKQDILPSIKDDINPIQYQVKVLHILIIMRNYQYMKLLLIKMKYQLIN